MSRPAAPTPTVRPERPPAPSRPGRPPAPRTDVRRRAALALLVSAQFVVMLDTSIVNVALPSISRDLGLGQTGASWVVNAYFLAFGGFLLLSGRVADVVGRRRMFLLGSAVFALATLTAGLATDPSLLLGARVLQGVGAAILSPAALSILLVLSPGPQRARAMSAWGAASTLGGATGVLVGGLVTGSVGWPWVFFVTLPVSAVALVAAPRLLERLPSSGARRRIDTLGATTVTGAALAVIYATLSVPSHGWASVHTLAGLALAALLLGVFVAAERGAADPLVPLDLFASPAVSAGVLLSVLGGAARASTFFLSALYLQQVLVLEPQLAGLAMVPTSLAGFVVSLLLLPRVLRAVGPERTMTVGLVVLCAGHLWLARAPLGASYGFDVLPGLLLAATGVALSFTPSTMVIASGIPTERAGLASGLAGSSSQVGAALGIAVFSAIAALGIGGGADQLAALADGFRGAFTAAGAVALLAAVLAAVLLCRRTGGAERSVTR